jgi:hypothetical protein
MEVLVDPIFTILFVSENPMSKFAKAFALSLLAAVLLVPTHALAAPAMQTSSIDFGPFLQIVQEVLSVIKGMTALAAVLTMIVNFAKSHGYIPDGTADVAFQILNLIAIVVLCLAKYFSPSLDFGALNAMIKAMLDNFAVIVPAVLVLVKLIGQILHGSLRGESIPRLFRGIDSPRKFYVHILFLCFTLNGQKDVSLSISPTLEIWMRGRAILFAFSEGAVLRTTYCDSFHIFPMVIL